jgi:phytoene dehydrogenase-like protein
VIPAKPLIVAGQLTITDPTRRVAGTEALWAYAHVPQAVRGDAGGALTGAWTPSEIEKFSNRIEAGIEASAPLDAGLRMLGGLSRSPGEVG